MIDQDAIRRPADIFDHWARLTPQATALQFEGRRTSYAALNHEGDQVANGLIALGLKPQARIGFLGRNSDRYFTLLAGAIKANMVIVGVNWRLAPPEVAYILKDAGCATLFVGAEYYGLVEGILGDVPDIVQVVALDGGHPKWPAFDDWRARQSDTPVKAPAAPDDDVIQLYTSGTTGHPKGAQLTNANYASLIAQGNGAGWLVIDPGDAQLVAAPFFHVAGVNMGLLGLAQGGRNVLLKDVDVEEILRLIPAERIKAAFLVPAVILFLTQAAEGRAIDFSSLKAIQYGASPISEDLLRRASALFGCGFHQLYGLTETLGGATCLNPADHAPERGKLRSCGKPAPGVSIRVVDTQGRDVAQGEVGEILFRGGSLMKGYWNNPEATAKAIRDGWFHTGDAGYVDADGFLYIHDRVKDMIVSGAENIYPAEVENALFGHPAIADVAVIGVPDETWGEAVKAIVVLKPGADLTIEDLRAWARARIAGYKLPKSLDIVEALPRNPSGKILRRELRAPYWGDRGRMVN